MASDHSTLQCQSELATDYYGLGVRLGVYFAWLGGYIANTILPSECASAADTSTIFLLTLLIAMAGDARTGELTQIDGLVLMHLCGGTVFGVVTLWGYRTRVYRNHGPRAVRMFGGFGTHIRLVVSLGVSIFGLWFWLYGVTGGLRPMGPDDGTNPPNSADCSVLYTFFFAKVRADGGIRYYYVVVCLSCILWFGTMLLVSSLAALASFDRIRSLVEYSKWTSLNRVKYATGFTHKELKFMFNFLRVANLIWLVFAAVTVEVTLNFNHVSGVLGGRHDGRLQLPGQLLPFLVGLFSFVKILYQLFKARWGGAGDEADSEKVSSDPTEVVEAMVISPTESTFPRDRDEEAGSVSPKMLSSRSESYFVARSLPVRYLVGWLPWLGMVVHPATKKSRLSILVSRGTGLSAVEPGSAEESVALPTKRENQTGYE
ncbi:hypothetical protein B0H67DRAFT_93960 [Lasiosphaeris hirsuta]|uniref:Uncharacterized protein n=1 Tax=Lasiosphaeris hirsuta TaxID=260670 RepID=A0AA40BD52_9PEZI|nr:hypothetical protein B0H67DRAFT_93960 [Lasiosphaeris hirsuta]